MPDAKILWTDNARIVAISAVVLLHCSQPRGQFLHSHIFIRHFLFLGNPEPYSVSSRAYSSLNAWLRIFARFRYSQLAKIPC